MRSFRVADRSDGEALPFDPGSSQGVRSLDCSCHRRAATPVVADRRAIGGERVDDVAGAVLVKMIGTKALQNR